MKIFSFCEHLRQWIPVEIEVSLIPGLPQIHILGLPDSSLKESVLKIKSALKVQGFKLPKGQQVIVNIRGGDFKKKSLGLDLAIVVGVLQAAKIIKLKESIVYVFGEISLKGEVLPMDPLLLDEIESVGILLTGSCSERKKKLLHVQLLSLKELMNFEGLKKRLLEKNDSDESEIQDDIKSDKKYFEEKGIKLELENERDYINLKFTPKEAHLLILTALGRHSLLLMGPRGLGKSTLAESLNFLSPYPGKNIFNHYQKYFNFKGNRFWRPFVKPHHSISHLALVGGGAQCSPGEITRAHGGILLLDEMLEFKPNCQEALREPIENKEVHLARGKNHQSYACDFQLLATTNLCPCGQWVPGKMASCHLSSKNCRSYREKLSGPMLDRFEILYFLKKVKKTEKNISLKEIKEQVQELRLKMHKDKLTFESIKYDPMRLSQSIQFCLTEELNSFRRLNASINIAKTLAMMAGRTEVRSEDMGLALSYTWEPFLALEI